MFGLRDIERKSAPQRAAELPGMRQQGIMLGRTEPSKIHMVSEERDSKERLRELTVESVSVPSMLRAENVRSPRQPLAVLVSLGVFHRRGARAGMQSSKP